MHPRNGLKIQTFFEILIFQMEPLKSLKIQIKCVHFCDFILQLVSIDNSLVRIYIFVGNLKLSFCLQPYNNIELFLIPNYNYSLTAERYIINDYCRH